jgi:SAM-dependent methyltransferase
MNPTEIGASYDQIAERWNGGEFDRTNGISLHERALTFLEHGAMALDVGCGCSGRFVDLLIDHGFRVEGLDVSEKMVRLARQRHPQVPFHCVDICSWDIPSKYDFVSAWDSTWHVPLSMQRSVITKICRSLNPGGVFIFTTGGMDAPEEKTGSEMGPTVYYSVLGIPKTLQVLAEAGCVCRHLEYDQYPERHLCIIAQRT